MKKKSKNKIDSRRIRDRALRIQIEDQCGYKYKELKWLATNKAWRMIPIENREDIRSMFYDMIEESITIKEQALITRDRNIKMKNKMAGDFHASLFKGSYGKVSMKYSREILAHQILFVKALHKAKQEAREKGLKEYSIQWTVNAKVLEELLFIKNNEARKILTRLIDVMHLWKEIKKLPHWNRIVELGYVKIIDNAYRNTHIVNRLNPNKNKKLDAWYKKEIEKL